MNNEEIERKEKLKKIMLELEELEKLNKDYEEKEKQQQTTKEKIEDYFKSNGLREPPKPKKLKTFSNDEIKKDLVNKMSNIPEQTGYNMPNIFLKYYLIPILIIIFNIAGIGFIFSYRSLFGFWFMIILLFYCGIVLPIFIGIIGYFIIRLLIFDKNKVTGKIRSMISKNFIIANFFLTQKRIIKRICPIDNDGISFHIKDNRYIIEKGECWNDEDNFINGYWLPNFPNQLRLNFAKYIDKYLESIKKGNLKESVDSEGNTIDLSYSSRNLEVFRKDKLFYEMHQQITPESMKLIYICLGVIALALIGFVIMFITK